MYQPNLVSTMSMTYWGQPSARPPSCTTPKQRTMYDIGSWPIFFCGIVSTLWGPKNMFNCKTISILQKILKS